MKITIETTDPKEASRLLASMDPTTRVLRPLTLPVPTTHVPHNKGKRRLVRHTPLHRRKCVLCKRGFLSKRSDSKFCHRPCMTHHVGTPLGDRLAKTGHKSKKLFTRKQLAAVRRNVVKARAALAAKHQAEKKAETKGAVLIKGDPLTPGLNP